MERTPEFRELASLVKAGDARVWTSTIVKEEWLTQRLSDFEKQRHKAQRELNACFRFFRASGLEIRDELWESMDHITGIFDTAREQFLNKATSVLNELQPQYIDPTKEHTDWVFNAYFVGDAPFSEVKKRDDIPDAFILCALRDAVESVEKEVILVSNDGGLGSESAELRRVRVVQSLKALAQEPVVRDATQNLYMANEWALWLEEYLHRLGDHEASIIDEIDNEIVDLLAYKEIEHEAIPSDNTLAIITGVGEPKEVIIEWEDWESFGVGMVTFPVTIRLEALIDFDVFRMEAFNVPEGVSVSIGDFEKDHYFEAQGYVELQVDGRIYIEIDNESIRGEEIPDEIVCEFEDEFDIAVLEDEGGEIFI